MSDPVESREGEAGFTLIEVLMAMVIMGIAIVAIITALGTAIIVANVNNEQARAQTIVQTWGEAIVNGTYQTCATTSGATSYLPGNNGVSATAVPAGFTATIVSVTFWDGQSGNPSLPNTGPAVFGVAPSPCNAGTDPGLQKLTLKITPPGNKGAQVLTMLKRSP